MTFDSYKAVILPQAESDIIEILDYIVKDLNNPTAAKKLWNDIQEAIGRAVLFPYAMPKVKNEAITLGKEYRRLDVDNYVVIYNIIEYQKEIRIFSVFYGPMNIITRILNRI